MGIIKPVLNRRAELDCPNSCWCEF